MHLRNGMVMKLSSIWESSYLFTVFSRKAVQSFKESLQHLNLSFHLNHKSSSYIGEYLPYMDIKNEIQLFCLTPGLPNCLQSRNYSRLKKFNQSLNMKVIDQGNGGQFKIIC